MSEPPDEPATLPKSPQKTEVPFLIRITAVAALVFFFVLMVLFLAGLIWSELIGEITGYYQIAKNGTVPSVLYMFLLAFLTHASAFAGILLLLFWRKKTGYYLLGIGCMTIMVYQILLPAWAIVPSALYFILLMLFGFLFPKLTKKVNSSNC